MNLTKALALLVIFGAACVTSGIAQIFWSNQSPAGITDDIWCVTYANGTCAAVTNQGNLLTSTNGLNWNSQAIDPGVWLMSIAYGNGTWVVVGDKGTILVSSDLKTWVKANSGMTNKLNCVAFDSGATPPHGSVFIAVGDGGTILSSTDGTNWVNIPSGVTNSLTGITALFVDVVVCGQGGIVLNNVQVGVTPTVIETGAPSGLNAMAFGSTSADNSVSSYIAVGGSGLIIHCPLTLSGMVAVPPTNWVSSVVPNTSATLWGIAFGNGWFVATGDNGTILSSTDAINWTQRFSGDSPSALTTSTLLSVAYSEALQRFVVTGTGGTILISNAPPTIFGNVSSRGYVSNTETLIGGFVIEGTAPRTVLIRADGPVLDTFSVPNPLPDPVLTVYNNSGTVIATNAGWASNTNPASISTAALEVGAFALPNLSPDSALLLTLQPGAYTAQVTSAGGNSGIVLFEAYTD
jgi:hypothetical protein